MFLSEEREVVPPTTKAISRDTVHGEANDKSLERLLRLQRGRGPRRVVKGEVEI